VSAQSTAQIRGVVRASQGFGIAGVTVNLLSVEKARNAKTDENGKFEFLDLPLNTYELEVSQAGFAGARPKYILDRASRSASFN
jgi:hypothetical protein